MSYVRSIYVLCLRGTYFILDFSKLIHRLLVKYNTIEGRISKPVVFVFSQLVLHRYSTQATHLQYVILHCVHDIRRHSTEKQVKETRYYFKNTAKSLTQIILWVSISK